MVSSKRIITTNGVELAQAEKLGLPEPKREETRTKVLFWKKDVMRVMITNEGNILVVTRDDDWIELEYEEKMWRELENYFKKNEE